MRTANRSALLFCVPAALALVLGLALFLQGDRLLGSAHGMLEHAAHSGHGDVEGYDALLHLAGAGMGGMMGMAVQLMALLTALYAGTVLILGLIGRAIYGKTPGRLLAYRILTGVTVVVLLSPVPDILRTFVRALADGSFLFTWLIYFVVVFVIAVKVCRNTYTNRIYH